MQLQLNVKVYQESQMAPPQYDDGVSCVRLRLAVWHVLWYVQSRGCPVVVTVHNDTAAKVHPCQGRAAMLTASVSKGVLSAFMQTSAHLRSAQVMAQASVLF